MFGSLFALGGRGCRGANGVAECTFRHLVKTPMSPDIYYICKNVLTDCSVAPMAVLTSQERAFQQGRAMAQRGARFGQGQGQGREEKEEAETDRDRLSDDGSLTLDEESGEGQEKEEGPQAHDRYVQPVRRVVSCGRWVMAMMAMMADVS